MEKSGFSDALFAVVSHHIDRLKEDFPVLAEERDRIEEILTLETEKFATSMQKGVALVRRHVKKTGAVTVDDLIEFYDSHGIHPEIVKEITDIEIPDNFEAMVAERHLKAEPEAARETVRTSLPPCRSLYYENDYERTFDAEIVHTKGVEVVLDRTLFYPEGGGQKTDTGTLEQGKKKARVLSVRKEGDAIVHVLDAPLAGGPVRGTVDWDRRYAMMRHHTATHIVNAAARTVLGSHVWQAGSELDEHEGRLDIAHYKRLTDDNVRRIEQAANETVWQGLPVEKTFVPRKDAEQRFGFRLYQGGAPTGSTLRVVRIADIEVEACGGMHVNNTAEVGLIKITGIERVQDGVERIRFRAGNPALAFVQRQEEIVAGAAGVLATQPENLVASVKKLAEERKRLAKEVTSLQERLGRERAADYAGVTLITEDDLTPSSIKDLTRENAVVVSASARSGRAVLTIACSEDLPLDCARIARKAGTVLGGGGGTRTIGQAGGDPQKLAEAKNKALAIVKQEIERMKK
jgi:alanyl-tRNA synthetase